MASPGAKQLSDSIGQAPGHCICQWAGKSEGHSLSRPKDGSWAIRPSYKTGKL